MKSFSVCLCVAAVVAAFVANPVHAQLPGSSSGISTKAVRIYESRSKNLVGKDYSSSSYVGLTVRFQGDAIKKLTRIGDARITLAKDNLGTNVAKTTTFSDKNLYRTYRSYNYSYSSLKADEHDFYLSLLAPARGAKSLAVVQGTVRMTTSEVDVVSIPVSKLNDLKGTIIADPLLKKAGVTVTLDVVTMTSTNSYAHVKFTGSADDREKFLRMRFEDRTGRIITQSTPRTTDYGSKTQGSGYVSISRKLAPDDVLKFEIETKRNDLTVTFDLKDIPLP